MHPSLHLSGFAAFWSFMGDPQATCFMACTDEQKTYEGAKALLQMVITSYTSDAPICALAITNRHTGAYIGSCGLSPSAEPGEVECYYVVAWVMAENPTSIRVAEKLGMMCDGMVHREDVKLRGFLYAITAQEFGHYE